MDSVMLILVKILLELTNALRPLLRWLLEIVVLLPTTVLITPIALLDFVLELSLEELALALYLALLDCGVTIPFVPLKLLLVELAHQLPNALDCLFVDLTEFV
jgi:hypothetical protein